jgi:hypothetical protein
MLGRKKHSGHKFLSIFDIYLSLWMVSITIFRFHQSGRMGRSKVDGGQSEKDKD